MNLPRIIELSKIARAAGTPGPMSEGEALTVALVLNRHDWLKDEGYTVAQALDRIDADTVQHLRAAERTLQAEFGPGPLSVSLDAQLAALREACVRRHEQLISLANLQKRQADEARAIRDRWIHECATADLASLKTGAALMRNASRNAALGGSPMNTLQIKMAGEYLSLAVAVALLRFGFDLEQGVFRA